MPKRLQKDESTATPTYARFVAEPFETGYGHTIGNSLRRVLLSSLEGAAITSVKIDGAMHEFTTIDGVVEDVTEIVLNLKKILFKCHVREPQTLLLSANKDGQVLAGDIQLNQNTELVNPKQLICTLDKKKKFEMELEVKVGRGFCPGDENKKVDQPIGVIAIDSLFSPVTRVRYFVENARVGQRTDYDRLTLSVETDGTVTPEEAVSYAAALAQTHFQYFASFGTSAAAAVAVPGAEGSSEGARLAELLRTPIDDLSLSVRSVNSLKNSSIRSLGDLVRQTETQILQVKNFGKKSLQEIADLLEKEGLNFGMKFEESTDGVRVADWGTPPSRAAANAPDDEEE